MAEPEVREDISSTPSPLGGDPKLGPRGSAEVSLPRSVPGNSAESPSSGLMPYSATALNSALGKVQAQS